MRIYQRFNSIKAQEFTAEKDGNYVVELAISRGRGAGPGMTPDTPYSRGIQNSSNCYQIMFKRFHDYPTVVESKTLMFHPVMRYEKHQAFQSREYCTPCGKQSLEENSEACRARLWDTNAQYL